VRADHEDHEQYQPEDTFADEGKCQHQHRTQTRHEELLPIIDYCVDIRMIMLLHMYKVNLLLVARLYRPCYDAPTMARACDITGKSTQIGGRYSNRTRATQYNHTGKVRRKANLQKRRVYVPELGKSVLVDISAKGLRHIKKNGAFKTFKKAGVI